jgi:hypothetical protein
MWQIKEEFDIYLNIILGWGWEVIYDIKGISF